MQRRLFVVTGCGNFPFVMMARDECFPLNEEEANKIYDACPTVAREQRIVMVTSKVGSPSMSLWTHFKWPAKYVE